MKFAALSLVFAAALAVPAFGQETPPAPPQDSRSQPPVVIDIPEGAFEVALPSEIKIDKNGVIVDGKRRFVVGHRDPMRTHRVVVVRIDDPSATTVDAPEGGADLTIGIPKSDSAAIVNDGRHTFYVRWRPQNSTLRIVSSEAAPSVTDEIATTEAEIDQQGPMITEEPKTVRPDPPLSVDASSAATAGYSLANPAPNPVIESTTIDFTLPRAGVTNLTVFDATGQPVATLVDDDLAAGRHTARFDASGLAAGRYFYRLSSGPFTETKTLTVVK